ncbi:squalene epoxidase-domain-containing protein [Stachybotrys elegans]|uniref:Squalene monooxygenase n=1 Tax=Stachybotrys elegans TaxID=80388 RepID=A0A8K0WR94_9HYPO|nr:squalene epoxidase-domain-containing protein [Stachybotrys elegans]
MATTTATMAPTSDSDARRRREEHHEAEAVIVGAGVFGCAMAWALANQGRSVILLERWMKEPDRIVGELLQPGGLHSLKKLGLGHVLEGIDAIACHGYNVIYRGKSKHIPYPGMDEDGLVPHRWAGDGEGGKKPYGTCFHHGRLIANLRRACLGHSNITVVETEVTNTVKDDRSDKVIGVESLTVNPKTGKKQKDYYFADLTIVADGYASKWRSEVLKSAPIVKSKFYALELIDCELPIPGTGHVVIGDTFPILIYQIGTHETRILFDVPTNLPEASPKAGGVRGYIKNRCIPVLPPSVRPSVERALEDGKLPRSMPNSWLPPTRQTARGLVVLGDAMNMRHPLTGGGMSVAFNDVLVLSELLHPSQVPKLQDTRAVQSAMDTFYWRRKQLTSIINVLAQALYNLFAADDRELRILQRGCFKYFENGTIAGPAGLLGGVILQPAVLAYHFFSVAFVAIGLHFSTLITGPLGVLKLPLALLDVVLILWKASVVFVPVMWREACR